MSVIEQSYIDLLHDPRNFSVCYLLELRKVFFHYEERSNDSEPSWFDILVGKTLMSDIMKDSKNGRNGRNCVL